MWVKFSFRNVIDSCGFTTVSFRIPLPPHFFIARPSFQSSSHHLKLFTSYDVKIVFFMPASWSLSRMDPNLTEADRTIAGIGGGRRRSARRRPANHRHVGARRPVTVARLGLRARPLAAARVTFRRPSRMNETTLVTRCSRTPMSTYENERRRQSFTRNVMKAVQ